ncbi:MAG: hypothetical protein IKW98_03565 [Prevotella sp.]|nr:hypothetical protein [Prevotella sp.]
MLPSFGQDEKKWSLQAGIGGISMLENKYHEGDYFVSEDQGNAFYVSADYWKSSRFALTGGVTFEQQGLYTDFTDEIGLKKINMLGANVGVKYYFFPEKWIFQPHFGASLYTNILNLGHQKGESKVYLIQAYPGTHGVLSYDVQCPALSLSPRIGFDIHLLSSLSLSIDYDYRIGLWGRSKAQLRFTDGPLIGETVGIDERNVRSCISIGLKMDFPAKPVSETAKNNLLWFLFSWISSKTYD